MEIWELARGNQYLSRMCSRTHRRTHLCKHKAALIIGHLLWRLTGCLTTQNWLADFSIIIKLLSSSLSGDMCKLVSVEQCHAELFPKMHHYNRHQLSQTHLHFAVSRLSASIGSKRMFCSLSESDLCKNQLLLYCRYKAQMMGQIICYFFR